MFKKKKINKDYYDSVRKSILDYVLKDDTEMARIGIAIRGGADKKGYFDWKQDIYDSEDWSREEGERLWDATVEDMKNNPLKEGQSYAPICDLD